MKFAESQTDGPHARLASLVGDWSGTTKTWFEPDKLADESTTTGTFRAILDGRFVLYEYKGEIQGNPLEGLAIVGFDLLTEKFQWAWIDSFHMSTGILFSEGEPGDKYSVDGTYFVGEGHPCWGWRTEIEQVDNDNLVVTAYNIMPGSEPAKATETIYKRN